MEAIEVSLEEYQKLIPDRKIFFNEPAFCELNRRKVDDVHYITIVDGNAVQFGLILGQKGLLAKCPFSAPYSYPVSVTNYMEINAFLEALHAIEIYARGIGIDNLEFVLPPLIYDENVISSWIAAFYRYQYKIIRMDLNYVLDLEALNSESYLKLISSKGRGHIKKAIDSGIEIIECETEAEFREAYNIVWENHTAKGRPTWLSFEELMSTLALVPHEAFIARLNGKGIASMIYYRVSNQIAQCIYSGYLPQYTNSGAMNYLSYYAIRFYGQRGFDFIDRATATENSIPNYGLCGFKESVGGRRTLKYSFAKRLTFTSGHAGGGEPTNSE